jgi:hypothetical protein
LGADGGAPTTNDNVADGPVVGSATSSGSEESEREREGELGEGERGRCSAFIERGEGEERALAINGGH